MEAAQVEARAERGPGPLAQFGDAQLADLVAERLGRAGDVAVDFRLVVGRRVGRVGVQVVDRLAPRPAHRVDAGIDHQARRAQHLFVELAEARERIAEEAELRPQSLGIGGPAFAEGLEPGVAAEGRQVERLGARHLQVVARHAFVQGHAVDLPQRPRAQLRHVDHQRGRAALAAGFVIGDRLAGALLRHRLDRDARVGNRRHHLRQCCLGARQGAAVAREQGLGILREQARVAAREGQEATQAAAKTGARHQRFHPGADARHFLQAEGVHLGRQQRGGGGAPYQEGVPGRAVRQLRGADRFARRRQVLVAQEALEAVQAVRGIGEGGDAIDQQFLAHLGLDRGRHAQEGSEQRAGRDVLVQGVQGARDRRQRHLRHGPAGAHPGAHLLDQAVDVLRQGVQAPEIVAVVGFGQERHLGHQARQAQLQAVPGADRLRIEGGEGPRRELALERCREQVQGQQLVVRQLAAVDLARRFQHLFRMPQRQGTPGQGGVAQVGVVAVLADAGRVFGLLAQLPLPLALEQLPRAVGRRVGGAAHERNEQDDRGEQCAHAGPWGEESWACHSNKPVGDPARARGLGPGGRR